ncbi:MAG: glycine cleavage system protein GcvH [Kocuria sp.]|mgnify:CR=1 FL=1|uniref:Glycine cleavage system H protein n=2 Tax=Kocuria TaxID=57493 RepID=A0A7D7KYY0_KOCVA|nr:MULTISPECIES: glycine cleavage system protein GcvH [Kocuria]MBS6030666.1 glycine cleavage system protein GcvH [Kocuria rhizophila]MDN5630864.1 glycine cleavage system protein GcvH [Kocuria sp.]MDO4256542.1 glycine cleavage system protein GcvH [Kocuria sp.]QMS56890.1 Glycine cleavage system H protein [Kocuria varians]RUP84738.1 glycine cleavage system protein GcvH [Kocuria sp. HSID17590]
MTNIPAELAYTAEHEWVEDLHEDDTFRVGITDHAQSELGEVVFVQLPEVGDTLAAGDVVGEIESTKSVSDLFAPVSGEIVGVNEELVENPGLLNESPYEAGWLFTVRAGSGEAPADLLDAQAYQQLLD